ncbi:hypothetical protein AMJ44_03965 [candidate division WOR-1 bacterium DG_54_3]|uniref:Uncharacterized protein n=1 Tax=candidate division WOR-1 bacterium DG_54_3 TaxID=1703775 RepID=A0A0S7Y480_UNCSA|nr:MAG: hypothetical protein AMJ44_03965 [candidate division WOR-1 bacterium DG_54_3]
MSNLISPIRIVGLATVSQIADVKKEEPTIEELTKKIEELTKKVEELTGKVEELENRLNTRVEGLENRLKNLEQTTTTTTPTPPPLFSPCEQAVKDGDIKANKLEKCKYACEKPDKGVVEGKVVNETAFKKCMAKQ